jgi:SAM-dependent methyltransferase
MQTSTRFWDGIAAKYAKSPIKDMPSYEYTLGRTRSYLAASDRVLELGCGTGSTALKLAGNVDEIVATDISGKMLDVGKQNAEDQAIGNVQFFQAEASNLPQGPYDIVMAFNLFHLLCDTNTALAQVHQHLKPGGLFISKTPCQPEQRAPISYRLIRLVLPLARLTGKVPFVRFMKIAEWELEIEMAGFEIIEVGNYPANPPNHYIVARKL